MPGKELSRAVAVILMRQLSDLPCGSVLGGKGSQSVPLGSGPAGHSRGLQPSFTNEGPALCLDRHSQLFLGWEWKRTRISACVHHLATGAGQGGSCFSLIGEMASSWRIPLGFISGVGSPSGLVRGS